MKVHKVKDEEHSNFSRGNDGRGRYHGASRGHGRGRNTSKMSKE
jgi:hypothetical protein